MSGIFQFNGKGWDELAKDGKDGVANKQEILEISDKAIQGHEGAFEHSLLHPSNLIGTKEVDEDTIGDNKFIKFDAQKNALIYDILPKVKEPRSSGGGGASRFFQLLDTPSSYSGQSEKGVRVKTDETGLEFTDFQVLDADLTAIAALGFTSTAFLKKTALNTWALDTNVYLTAETDPLSWSKASAQTGLTGDKTGSFNLTTTGTLGAGATTVTSLDTIGTITVGTVYSTPPTTGLKVWLKADAIVGLNDGDTVVTWADSSGLGNDGTGAGTPTYETNELNSKPVVRFNGSNAYFTFADIFSAQTAGEVFVVIKCASEGQSTGFWYFGTAAAQDSYTWGATIYDGWGSNGRKTVGDPALALASFRVYNVISTSTEWTANLDTAQLYTTGTNTVAFNTTPRLGRSASSLYFAGDIAEIIIYSAKLSTADRSQVQYYLQSKYGMSYAGSVTTVQGTGGVSSGGNISSYGTIQGSFLKGTTLTAGRVPFVGAGGLLADRAGFLFDSATPRLTVPFAMDVADINGNTNFQVAAYPTAVDTIIAGAGGNTAGKVYISTGGAYYKGIVLTYLDVNTTRIGMGGITSPTAILNIGAGTATAGTAPLKFTSGTLLTAAEAGTIEYLTDTFYIRGTDNLNVAGTGTFNSLITNSINILCYEGDVLTYNNDVLFYS